MTSQAVLSHIAHFCSKLPGVFRTDIHPTYDLDPSDYPIGYHEILSSKSARPTNPGPFHATLTLPRLLPPHLRIFKSHSISETKDDARKKAAFKAYKALYEAGLLSENLLPLSESLNALREGKVHNARNGVLNLTQRDPWQSILGTPDNPLGWYESRLEVDEVGSLRLFTRSSLRRLGLSPIILHGPEHGQVRIASILSKDNVLLTAAQLQRAQQFTRRLFSVFYGKRLEWDNLDFAYLFLPTNNDDDIWEERRAWADGDRQSEKQGDALQQISANLAAFGSRFEYPADVGLLVDSWAFFEFVEWRSAPLDTAGEDQVRKRYRHLEELDITYPVAVARLVKHRNNFLVPSPEAISSSESIIILPTYARVILDSKINTAMAMVLPSIIRALLTRITAMSLQAELLDRAPSLMTLPTDIVEMALTSPSANAHSNYERLETLGDTVLKLVATVHLLAVHPHWPEGFLVAQRRLEVSNDTLSDAGMKNHLYQWIMRAPFVVRKWMPSYQQRMNSDGIQTTLERLHLDQYKSIIDENEDELAEEHQKATSNNLSLKTLADVVEALIGAAYLSGGLDCSIDCMNVLGIYVSGPWTPLSTSISKISSRDQPPDLPVVELAEKIILYTFKNKGLLIEALMDANYIGDIESMSYERLRLAGDAILDMIVVDSLYRADTRNFTPAEMHSRKTAVVNSHFLAFVCLRAHALTETAMPAWNQASRTPVVPVEQGQRIALYQCLFHTTSALLNEQHHVVTRFQASQEAIEAALDCGSYPWAALAEIRAPKYFGDIVESIIGAIYFDSGGQLSVVEDILEHLGIMKFVNRLIQEEVDLTHPVTKVMEWAGKHQALDHIRFHSKNHGEKVTCSLELQGQTIAAVTWSSGGEITEDTLRLLVAAESLPLLMRDSH